VEEEEEKESKVGREKHGGEVGCVKKKNEACKTAYSCAGRHIYPEGTKCAGLHIYLEGAKPYYCVLMQSCK
jgi:hypothetical protein